MFGLFTPFAPSYAKSLIYMLQSTEYDPKAYLSWYWRALDFRYKAVAKRRTLERTKAARLLLLVLRAGILLQIVLAVLLAFRGWQNDSSQQLFTASFVFLSYPIIWGHLILLPMFFARKLVVVPKEKKLIKASGKIFKEHPGIVIAVAGSYGKTTAKELLLTVLSEGKKVAATPANKNVASSHAAFARKLSGDEEVVVIEYGEGEPGDVARFTATTEPDIAVITGIAPAHLDKYKSLDQAAKDIFSVAEGKTVKQVFVNQESPDAKPYINRSFISYNIDGVLGWKVSRIKVEVDGMSFTMTHGKRKLSLKTQLVGRHLIGTLAMVVSIAADAGLTDEQIKAGVAKTKPFEHRMQPRMLAGGWVIDDSYNGNLEGLRAGLALLTELKAKRKIYVTPGLVDQGAESERVHKEVGRLIAEAKPDKVVLMKNSVTDWIQTGMDQHAYKGELIIEDDPLNFYTNMSQVIAVGDVLLMQNDWTDNYN